MSAARCAKPAPAGTRYRRSALRSLKAQRCTMVCHMVLIEGARGIHPKAKKLGLRLSLLMRTPRLLAQKKLCTYDRIVGTPVSATGEEWVALARLIDQVDPIDAIGGFTEVSQRQATA